MGQRISTFAHIKLTAHILFAGHADFLQDKKVILLESAPEKKNFKLSERFSNRTCAISPSTVSLFQSEYK